MGYGDKWEQRRWCHCRGSQLCFVHPEWWKSFSQQGHEQLKRFSKASTARLKEAAKNVRCVRSASLRACLRQSGIVHFQSLTARINPCP